MPAVSGYRADAPPDDAWLDVTQLIDGAGLRLAGWADLLSAGVLARAIAALPPIPVIHLELAGLAFIDARAVRELVIRARAPAPRLLVLHDPPRDLLAIVALVWPDAAPQFVAAAAR
jgi:hypothetical protein